MRPSFSWSEDLNETLNYLFWLRRAGKLQDEVLVDRARHILGLAAFEGHVQLRAEVDFSDYLLVWRRWNLDQIRRKTYESRITPVKTLRAHYEAVAAIQTEPFTVQWVMAPFGERWVLPPRVVLLGADGGTAEERRNAVVESASALRVAAGNEDHGPRRK